ncbi:hypothetical protein ACIP2X_18760 [Streptomyces sp. NPDC089424]|uniref:hypothetical protein n=1 Tax=Streptomyces sp. NPDC089424 TaxID=3365917 RepID=UPI0037FA85FC
MTTNTTATDAAGRPLHQGDHVGGTYGRHQTTITGPVIGITGMWATVLVANRPLFGDDRPGNGDDVRVSTRRLFLIHPATERRFTGYRTPDGRTWTQAARVTGVLWEVPLVPHRFASRDLRRMYGADLQPVWQDVAAAPANTAVRTQAFAEAAARIWDLPQDDELDPGRGDARELLERLAADTAAYPLALPWALLMDDDDLIGFLNEVAGVMQSAIHMATEAGHVHARRILAGLEQTCGTWRLIAQTQHAHNTAPGQHAETTD